MGPEPFELSRHSYSQCRAENIWSTLQTYVIVPGVEEKGTSYLIAPAASASSASNINIVDSS